MHKSSCIHCFLIGFGIHKHYASVICILIISELCFSETFVHTLHSMASQSGRISSSLQWKPETLHVISVVEKP